MNIIINKLKITILTHIWIERWVDSELGEPYKKSVQKKLDKPMLLVESEITAEMPGDVNGVYTDGNTLYVCIENNGVIAKFISTGYVCEVYEKPTELMLISKSVSEATF